MQYFLQLSRNTRNLRDACFRHTTILFMVKSRMLHLKLSAHFCPVQRWTDPEVIDLEKCRRGVIKAKKDNADTPSYVLPCSVMEDISQRWYE
ncbi:hypothetical protein AX15_002882 [Amanita polypyramis BW_CC]|nr:hypothetical protein AX15_002882 [Amanita polypyramis BW_CC]